MLKKILIFIILIILKINIVYAISEEMIYLDCNKVEVNLNEEIEIIVRAKESEIVAYNLYLYFDNKKLEYISGPENTNEIQNRIISVWYDETGGSIPKNGEIVRFVFKAKSEGTAKINLEGDFYDTNGELINVDSKENYIEIINKELVNDIDIAEETENNADLEVLAIENELLYPPFDSNITNYDVEISSTNDILNIFAVPVDENASLEILGNEELKEGNNQIKIIVISKNNVNKKIYEINAHKRNSQEEIKYENEQKINEEKLEKIYQAEKVNVEIGNFEEESITKINEEKDQKSNLILVLTSLLILFFVVMIIILKNKINHNKRK